MNPEPGKIAIAGDWHHNQLWATSAIVQACARLDDPKIILQAGDFGIWRETAEYERTGKAYYRQAYPEALTETLEDQDAYLWFCEGNHENHPYLSDTADEYQRETGWDYGWITPRIRWLPRGTRWEWHGKTWLALGGAVSVDKLLRTEGIDWFPGEEITGEQEALAIAGGPADVLLSHDAPADAPLVLARPAPEAWQPMIPRAEEHRERLQRVCMAVKPSYIFHGHYHQSSVKTVHAAWGKCRFTALDMDGRQENWGILDTETMEWEW